MRIYCPLICFIHNLLAVFAFVWINKINGIINHACAICEQYVCEWLSEWMRCWDRSASSVICRWKLMKFRLSECWLLIDYFCGTGGPVNFSKFVQYFYFFCRPFAACSLKCPPFLVRNCGSVQSTRL